MKMSLTGAIRSMISVFWGVKLLKLMTKKPQVFHVFFVLELFRNVFNFLIKKIKSLMDILSKAVKEGR